jgi:hypothetical protein
MLLLCLLVLLLLLLLLCCWRLRPACFVGSRDFAAVSVRVLAVAACATVSVTAAAAAVAGLPMPPADWMLLLRLLLSALMGMLNHSWPFWQQVPSHLCSLLLWLLHQQLLLPHQQRRRLLCLLP